MSLDDTEDIIRIRGDKDIIIVVMGNNPSVSSTPKMAIAETLADRIKDLNICMVGLHPNAAGSRFPVNKTPFKGSPMMPWSKLPMHLYRAHNWHCLDGSLRTPYASIYTSMGCPYDCYYCNIHALYGDRKLRLRPLADIEYELNVLVNTYRVRNIKIWDELFALDEGRVYQICARLAYYPDLNIWAYARLDTITEGMLKVMSKAGIRWLAYGFESMKDPKFTSRAEEVIKMTREYGISIIANFMFGLPSGSLEADQQSVYFAMKHLFEFVNFYDAKPYPGSKWHEDVKDKIKGMEFDQYKEISPFRQKAFKDYFTNPAYLSMLEKKWGIQAVNQIKDMLSWRIIK